MMFFPNHPLCAQVNHLTIITGNTPTGLMTMVFPAGRRYPIERYTRRYATADDAVAGHKETVELISQGRFVT